MERASIVEKVTGDGTTYNAACLLWSITLIGGSDASGIIIKDNTAEIWSLSMIDPGAAGDVTISISFAKPIIINTNLVSDITGTGAVVYLTYEPIGSE